MCKPNTHKLPPLGARLSRKRKRKTQVLRRAAISWSVSNCRINAIAWAHNAIMNRIWSRSGHIWGMSKVGYWKSSSNYLQASSLNLLYLTTHQTTQDQLWKLGRLMWKLPDLLPPLALQDRRHLPPRTKPRPVQAWPISLWCFALLSK